MLLGCALLAALLPTVAHAWSGYSHRLIGRLAETELTPQARAEVARLLRGDESIAAEARTLGGVAFDADIVPPVKGRKAEGAAGAPLAVEAMAQRHQLRLTTAFGPQLPAGAGGDAGSAGHASGAPP